MEVCSQPLWGCSGEAWWGRSPDHPLPASMLQVRREVVPLSISTGQWPLHCRVGWAREERSEGKRAQETWAGKDW